MSRSIPPSPNVAQDGPPDVDPKAEARALAIRRAEAYLSQAVPPPPTQGVGDLTPSRVLEICRLVALWTPINAAMRALGRRENHDDWRRYAQESMDPFWPWALAALQTAEGISIHLGTDALRDNALSGDTKAIIFHLAHRTHEYAPPAQRHEVAVAGTIDIEVSQRATTMIEDARGRVGSLLPAAKQIEDAEFEPAAPAPEPPEKVPATSGGPGSMFKMRPREKEE